MKTAADEFRRERAKNCEKEGMGNTADTREDAPPGLPASSPCPPHSVWDTLKRESRAMLYADGDFVYRAVCVRCYVA